MCHEGYMRGERLGEELEDHAFVGAQGREAVCFFALAVQMG